MEQGGAEEEGGSPIRGNNQVRQSGRSSQETVKSGCPGGHSGGKSVGKVPETVHGRVRGKSGGTVRERLLVIVQGNSLGDSREGQSGGTVCGDSQGDCPLKCPHRTSTKTVFLECLF